MFVDAVNRRGVLRLDGDGPLHYFAMLPYGMIGYHGAPAELLHAVASHHDPRAARTAEAAVLYHANQLDAVAATRPVPE